MKKYALITGATSGIGKASSFAFAKSNYITFLTGRNEGELKKIKDELGKNCYIFSCDLYKEKEREKLFNFVQEKTNKLDVLVNCAGIISSGNIENTTIDNFKEMMEINLFAPFHLIKLFLNLNVSSVTGKRAFPNLISYCVSKAALDHMTRCLSLELANYGIRVNAVNPGVVVTNLHKRGGMDEMVYKEFLERSKTTHPLGRVGKPEEIAELILFLASEKAQWITGETISIDGGRSQTCAR